MYPTQLGGRRGPPPGPFKLPSISHFFPQTTGARLLVCKHVCTVTESTFVQCVGSIFCYSSLFKGVVFEN